MKTPKEYLDNLRKGIITEPMITDVLYSYSKRAKNYRDRIYLYRDKEHYNPYWFDRYDSIEKYEIKKSEYYRKKSDILKHYDNKIKAIHKLTFQHRKRIYDYDKEYTSLAKERDNYRKGITSKVVWMNKYVNDEGEYVEFCDIIQSVNRYFLYYEFNTLFTAPYNQVNWENTIG